jgi:hypothetical protein
MKHSDVISDDEAPTFSDDEEEKKHQLTQKDKNNVSSDTLQHTSCKCFSVFDNNRYHEVNILFYRFSLGPAITRCNSQINNPWNRHGHSQYHNQRRQIQRNRNVNPIQNRPNFGPQYSFQNNMFRNQARPLFPSRGMHPRFRSYVGYGAAYNEQYNPNNMFNVNQYGQEMNFQPMMFQHPRIPVNAPARFNPVPFYPINNPQVPNFSQFSYMDTPYPYAQPSTSTHTNTGLPSTSIPPTSFSSTISTTTVDKNQTHES